MTQTCRRRGSVVWLFVVVPPRDSCVSGHLKHGTPKFLTVVSVGTKTHCNNEIMTILFDSRLFVLLRRGVAAQLPFLSWEPTSHLRKLVVRTSWRLIFEVWYLAGGLVPALFHGLFQFSSQSTMRLLRTRIGCWLWLRIACRSPLQAHLWRH